MRIRILFLYSIIWFLQANVVAQKDSTYNVFQQVKNLKEKDFLEKKAHVDSLYRVIAIDSTTQKATLLPATFKDQYKADDEFNYEREKTDLTFWKRLMNKLDRLMRKLLGLAPDYHMSEYSGLVVKIIAGIIVLVALYFVVRLVMNHSGSWLFQKKDGSIDIDINNTEQLIEEANFAQLIADYESRGDTRQSIRLQYLWLLQELKDNGKIDWHPEKTNADYEYELKDEKLKREFRYLSYLFNYIWYGEFPINENEYNSAKSAFMAYRKKGVTYG